MNSLQRHIISLLFVLPLIGSAQRSLEEDGFYRNLGVKDAKFELEIIHKSDEDERDFWTDQEAFELALQVNDPKAYRAYLNGKHLIYRQHRLLCDEGCGHSDLLVRKIAYYLVEGQSDIEGMVVRDGRVKRPQ